MRFPKFRWLLIGVLFALATAVRAEVLIGEPVPAFDVRLLNGKTMAFNGARNKPTIIVFWATWCPPCYPEMEDLQKLYDRYRDRGLEIVAIGVNTERAAAEDYVRKRGFTYPIALGTPRHTEIFGPMLFPPRLFLVGPDGRLLLNHWGPLRLEALEATLKPLL